MLHFSYVFKTIKAARLKLLIEEYSSYCILYWIWTNINKILSLNEKKKNFMSTKNKIWQNLTKLEPIQVTKLADSKYDFTPVLFWKITLLIKIEFWSSRYLNFKRGFQWIVFRKYLWHCKVLARKRFLVKEHRLFGPQS